MKKQGFAPFLLLLFQVLFLQSLLAQNPEPSGVIYGFRDLQFGDSLGALPSMYAMDQAEDSAYIFCRRKGDALKIDSADVDIVYTYYNRQLATVYIQTKGKFNSREVLHYLERSYGKGTQEDKYLYNFVWRFPYMVVNYNEHVITGDARIYLNSLVYRKTYKAPGNGNR